MAEALSVNDAARYIGVGRTHLYNLLSTGEGPPSFRAGKRRLFRKDALDQWMKVQERRELVARVQREIAAAEATVSQNKMAA